MKPVCVLHIKDSAGLFGSERVILALARTIDRSLFKPTLLCLDRGDGRSSALQANAAAMGIEVIHLEVKGKIDSNAICKMRKLVAERHFALVHTHDFKSDFYGLLSTVGSRVKRIATAHGSTRDSWQKRAYLFLDERLLYRFIDKIVSVSDDVARSLPSFIAASGRLAIVPNGVDILTMQEDSISRDLLPPLQIPDCQKIVSVVGRLFADKGHRYFLEALAKVRAVHPDAFGVIVGEGPERGPIENMIRALGLTNAVSLTGFRSDMVRIYKKSNIVAVPSLREGLPITVLEALWLNRPVVATRVGDISRVVRDGETGYLVPPGNVTALAGKIIDMLDNPERASQMAQAGHRLVAEKYTAARMARQMEVVYQSVLASSLES